MGGPLRSTVHGCTFKHGLPRQEVNNESCKGEGLKPRIEFLPSSVVCLATSLIASLEQVYLIGSNYSLKLVAIVTAIMKIVH